MLKDLILEHLTALGQKQLFVGVETLSPSQQEIFYAQLKKYDSLLLKRQKEALFRSSSFPQLEPLRVFDQAGDKENAQYGKELLSQGKVGCLILAGGQGSRLGASQPKGLLPLTPVRHKSLLQLFLEKAKAASIQAGCVLPVAIMTSPLNHIETLSFLEKHRWFGVKEPNCRLFLQAALPYLDESGNWLLEAPGVLAEGADGNGNSLINFFNSGIWTQWKERGIEHVNLILIDNPLADPFDAELIGYHAKAKADVTIKGILRRDQDENVGVVGIGRGQLRVVEYSELPANERAAVDADGFLQWRVANISLFCFSMHFIEGLARNPHVFMPWHMAKKSTKALASGVLGERQEMVKAWKCETFIFDVLNFTTKAKVIVYPREETFAPLKDANSLEMVQKALQDSDRRVFERITGKEAPKRVFELDQAFYYPTAELIQKWRGKELPSDQDYIEAYTSEIVP